ncbi:MAG: phosphoribosylformylglycinamidine cyclo-ligase [Chloroflexi bacterium]|nr:phosphoribosylformylglycinamidine cyclo-ligase [Chloroflexota bacterium]
MPTSYKDAGVDIDAANRSVQLIKTLARSTFRPEVLTEVGFFGGMFQLGAYHNPVLVSSVDGVGTKLKIAFAMAKHDTVGVDLVNHCVNDILTCGAEPLFFLDYCAMGKLIPEMVESIVRGMSLACKEAGCALIGGETAEMPGFYGEGEYDLAGFILGVVEREKTIDGRSITPGDSIVGLPSSGLHTNGYSLVRKAFGLDGSDAAERLKQYYPELGHTLGEELLRPHRCYYPPLKPVLSVVKGLAHITGGGFIDNIPRVLPPGMAACIDPQAWSVPPIFRMVQQLSALPREEMFRVFNMGIGMGVFCAPHNVETILNVFPEAKTIGQVVEQKGLAQVILA